VNHDTYIATRGDMILDPKCQTRPGGLDEEHVLVLCDAIREGQELPPLRAVRNDDGAFHMYDGWHRLEAYQREGVEEFQVSATQGDADLGRLLACGANIPHGLKLSREQIKQQVMLGIERGRDRSDRELATLLGVSHPTIAKYRREMQETAISGAEPTSAPDPSGNFTTTPPPAGRDRDPSVDDEPPRKPAKTEPAPWSGGDDVPDRLRKLPEHCIAEWDRASLIASNAMTAIASVSAAMAQMVGGAFEQALVSEGAAKVKDAGKLVKAAQPWALCPACRGRQAMQVSCNCCKSAGFVLRGVWDNLPKGAKV